MKKLNEILAGLSSEMTVVGSSEVTLQDVHLNSRKVKPGDAFVALKGSASDGHDYISSAINNGATIVFCQYIPDGLSTKVTFVTTDDIRKNLGLIASGFYGYPDRKLQLLGVTGTNGKTTVATMFFNMLRKMQISCGLLSTVKISIDEEVVPSELTTPDIFTLYRFLKKMVEHGCEYAIMEVSSHAIAQGRIDGLNFVGAAFTNISHDHLDYHKTFKEYINTKKMFFDQLDKSAFAITNLDDRNGSVMVQNSKARIYSYGLKSVVDYKAKILEHDFTGMHLHVGQIDFYTSLVGKFNVYNLLTVVAIADQLGFEMMEVLTVLSNVATAPGRFDLVRNEKEDISAIVDYAHTPDALENVLSTIHKVNKNRGQIITVVGAGGDRDKTKRPLMAKVAVNYSDKVILTSDNPRSEDPEDILDDMQAGVGAENKRKVIRISDRKSAIQTAISIAKQTDVILIAGKGHEDYQEIKGVKYPFDDKQILQEFLLE